LQQQQQRRQQQIFARQPPLWIKTRIDRFLICWTYASWLPAIYFTFVIQLKNLTAAVFVSSDYGILAWSVHQHFGQAAAALNQHVCLIGYSARPRSRLHSASLTRPRGCCILLASRTTLWICVDLVFWFAFSFQPAASFFLPYPQLTHRWRPWWLGRSEIFWVFRSCFRRCPCRWRHLIGFCGAYGQLCSPLPLSHGQMQLHP